VSEIDEAADALEDRDWSDAELVDDQPRRITVVHSVRMSHELSDRLLAEAHRRGATPSEVIRDLVEAGLKVAEDSATVRLADVHRVIDMLGRTAA
jgi:predicted DNA-binding protein